MLKLYVCVCASGSTAPLIHLFCFGTVCLFMAYASPLVFFSLLVSLLPTPLRTFSLENRRAPFPGWRSYKATRPGLFMYRAVASGVLAGAEHPRAAGAAPVLKMARSTPC